MSVAVKLQGIRKSYGALEILKGLDLDIADGSFTSLLGPSGCGKTTLLNMIGGLDQPTSGDIRIYSDEVFSKSKLINVPIERRNIGFVFQNYALWPHMTVLQNVGFSLKLRGIARAEREKRSREMLERLELAHLADRYPYQLSGGQQQRVAIARALVYQPRLLLLDEPLSNLDAQLRERARSWLKDIHQAFKLTTILVTHDQVEALSLSDQVVLLNNGGIEQKGSATEIYSRPATVYVADFVGGSNIIGGKLSGLSGRNEGAVATITTSDGTLITARSHAELTVGMQASIAVRPQKVVLSASKDAGTRAGSVIGFVPRTVLYHGGQYEVIGDTPFGHLRVLSEHEPAADTAYALLPTEDCLCVPA
jgi:iron(III) transport system ATP-binding protein